MEYSRILKEIYEEIQPYAQEGKPASYIPEPVSYTHLTLPTILLV